MTDLHYSVDADGVAIITWDMPDRSMNVVRIETMEELDAILDRALDDDAVKGIVLTSGKETFAAGMDLNVLYAMKDRAGMDPAQGVFDGMMRMHQVIRKLERAGMDPKTLEGGKPVAAALPGTALGLGLELPMACHRIFAADTPKAKIGFPEITIGIFPGAGGTTRLPRKLGLMGASPYLLEGKLVDPNGAKSAGLIDEVVAAGDLLETARRWVLTATPDAIVKPWDRKGYTFPGGAPYSQAGFQTFLGASAMVNGKTKGCYPSATAMLQAIYEGALVDFDTALRIEARHFTATLMNPSSGAMIRSVFLNKEKLDKGVNRPEAPDQKVQRLGVLGAGMMGAGIAHVAAQAGIDVTLIDQSQDSAERGKGHSEKLLDKDLKRGKIGEDAKAKTLGRITPSTDFTALSDCDLVVEAVFEDPDVKAETTKKAEAELPDDAIFATNTSTIPITDLAGNSVRPDQFIGIHFFSPVDKMMLVEIIRGRDTGDRAVAKALDFCRQIRKTPIVVNDARFFYANRCILPYINEGIRMVAEGVSPPLVENAAKQMGMPLGPLQLMDEISIELGAKIARATKADMGADYPDDDVDAVIFRMEDEGRLGRKSKSGFYTYDDKGARTGLWPELWTRYPPSDDQPDLPQVQHRLMLQQVLEAVRAFEQGVLMDIREGDVASILGWGFAPWSGGPFGWLDILGADRAVAICDGLERAHGPRFAAPAILRDLAKAGESFYGRFGDGQAVAA